MSNDSIFQFAKKDLMVGKVYEPAWYRIVIDEFSSEPAKFHPDKTPSTNYKYSCRIRFNADTGDKKYEDYPLDLRFNSKAMGFVKGFLVALGEKEEEITEDRRFDFKAAIGKELDVMVENGVYEGRLNNQVNKYRAPRTEQLGYFGIQQLNL